jgi:hypothetical protein
MSPIFQRIAVVALSYFGIFVPTPAPDGWQAYREPGFILHLPPDWKEIPSGEQPGAAQTMGRHPEQGFQFAPSPSPGAPRVDVWLYDDGKLDLSNIDVLRKVETDLLSGTESMLARAGMLYSLGPTVYDGARHRLWLRIVAGEKGSRKIFTLVVLLLQTETGLLQIGGSAPGGDEDFEGTFQEIVGSLELDEGLEVRQPPTHWASAARNFPLALRRVSKDRVLPRSERSLLLGSLMLGFLISLAGLAQPVLSLLDASVLRGRLKAAAVRRLQGSPLRRLPRDSPVQSLTQARLRRVPLRWSLAWQITLAPVVAFGLLPRFLHSPQIYGPIFGALSYAVAYSLLAVAVGLHYIPNTRRRPKYELLAAALTVLAVPGTLADPWLQAGIVGQDALYLSSTYMGNFLSQTIYFVLAGLIFYPLLRTSGDRTARRAWALYHLTHRVRGLPAALVAVAPLFPAGGLFGSGFLCLVACYLIGEKALESPFLYLRSFHDSNSSVVLAKIIMPAAGRFAPVLSTAHSLQPPEELYRKTNALTTARLTVLPDGAWQEWILTVLPRCRAVLIDASVASGSLLWELEQARAALPPQKIAVLAQEDASAIDLPGVPVLRYRLGWRGRRQARKALSRWLKALRRAERRSLQPTPRSSEVSC